MALMICIPMALLSFAVFSFFNMKLYKHKNVHPLPPNHTTTKTATTVDKNQYLFKFLSEYMQRKQVLHFKNKSSNRLATV